MTSSADADAARRRGALLVLAAAVCWSTGGLLARLVDTGPWTIVFWRGIFCALSLLVVLALRHGTRLPSVLRGMRLPGLALAFCFAASSTGFILALSRTSVANVLIIQSTGPFIAGLLGWLALGERVAGRTWAAMAAALVGTAVMVSGSWAAGTLVGDGLALAVAATFAAGAVILRRHHDVPMLPAVCLASLIAAGVAWSQAAPGDPAWSDLGLLALFGAGQLALGLILFTTGAPRIPVAQASLMAVLETVLGPLWVWLALGERPGTRSLAGGAVVLLALVVHTAAELSRPTAGRSGALAAQRKRSSTSTP